MFVEYATAALVWMSSRYPCPELGGLDRVRSGHLVPVTHDSDYPLDHYFFGLPVLPSPKLYK